MSHIVRINVGSGGRTGGVGDSREGRGALAGTCARTRRIERGDSAVLSAYEAVIHIARVRVPSRDHPLRVDAQWLGALAGTCARARRIEGGDSAVLSANVAVSYITGVSHIPRDIPRSVHAVGACALAGTCARARSFIRSEGAVGSAHVAVKQTVRVKIPSCDHPCRVDPDAEGGDCARRVECDDSGLRLVGSQRPR